MTGKQQKPIRCQSCGKQMDSGELYYLVPNEKITEIHCATCQNNLLDSLDKEFSRRKELRDRAISELQNTVGLLHSFTCAEKRTA